jgi:hypothetical protein
LVNEEIENMTNSLLTVVFYITVTYFILMAIAWLYNFVIYMRKNKEHVFSPKFYIKEIPFFLNQKAMYRVRTAGQFLGIVLLSAVIAFTWFSNITPFGITVQYAMEQNTKSISKLGPNDRAQTVDIKGQKMFKQIGDIAYFTTDMPFAFDQATIRVFYQNPNQEQTISIGYQNQQEWNYDLKFIDVPFLNNLKWVKNGYNPALFQREQHYTSADSFLSNPPENSVIGTFNYDTDLDKIAQTRIPYYSPQSNKTVINTALRGSHTIYAYLENEPFQMNIIKQDLNWYEGADDMTVKIYKGKDIVYEIKTEDDGVQDQSHKIMPEKEIQIKNPGKELPETGVYKIVIETNGDTIIKKISTNLHKLVFANSIFPVTNSKVYNGIVATTSATTVFTNAPTLSAQTYHEQGKQNILVGNQVLGVHMLQSAAYLPPKDDIAQVTIPLNDVVLNGFMGYFAFSRDQFFLPTKYHILPITKPEDVGLVDYILTDYLPSHKEGEWQVNEQTFDLRTAYIKDNKLSWIIKAPKLKERGGNIIIKDIQITFHKKGWL